MDNSTPILPASQAAIIQDDYGAPGLARSVPLPPLKAGTVLVKTVAVALNPSDYKMGATFPTPGAIIGMDFAGTVAAIHPETQTDLQIGDRVCGMVHGSNPTDPANGAFAEYARIRPELLLRVPRDLPMEQAATLGVGLMTNVMALWADDALALGWDPTAPAETLRPVLVYGGSTATGTLATQLLRLSGLRPVVTCSPRNFDLVQARGVARGDALEYVRPDVVDEVKRRTNGKLKHAYDCVTDPASIAHCYAMIGRTGGRFVSLEMVPEDARARRAVRHRTVLGYEGLGDEVHLSGGYESSADPDKLALAVKYFAIFQGLLDKGKLKAHPVQMVAGGLPGVLEGLQLLKSGSVSGKKLVAVI